VYAPDIDAGSLRDRFDVLILPDDAAVLERRTGAQRVRESATAPDDAPDDWRARSGVITREASVPQLRRFLEAGGSILAIGGGTSLVYELELPIHDALADESGTTLPRTRFYIPGSVLQMRFDTTHALTYGMRENADVFFQTSPAFRVLRGATGVRTLGWFDSGLPLRSGWAWGQELLEGNAGVVEIAVGRGRLVLHGPEIAFRAQPHGTFRLLFNGIYLSGMTP
jgi:hypothetical protein